MSIKGSRAATKNLSTLIECSENGDDSASLMLAEDSARKQDGCFVYETESPALLTNDDDTIVECATIETSSPSGSVKTPKQVRNSLDSTLKSRSESSPKVQKREPLSEISSESFSDLPSDYPTGTSMAKLYSLPVNTNIQKSFSFRALLNNMTAPVRRGKQDRSASTSHQQARQKDVEHLASVSTDELNGAKSDRTPKGNSAAKKIDFYEARERPNLTPRSDAESSRQSASDPSPVPPNIERFRAAYVASYLKAIDDSLMNRNRDDDVECQVCFSKRPLSQIATLINCPHRPCRFCLELYLKIEIMENRVLVTCPECSEPMHPNDIYSLLCLNHNLLLSYERFMVRRVLMSDPDVRWCPGPDCDYAVIANACAACPKLECERPECGTLFCYHCKGEWHANQTCDEARGKSMERMFASAANALNRSGSLTEIIGAASSGANELFKPSDLKACPRCHTLIVKMNDGSCNHLVCPMCQADFCWLCLKEISDLHYLSPTGCTFWGKKPWTRKKKLLWQIGTLIGAPVGIALIAGLAVPGIICGVPVFVGRKIYQRLSSSNRARRRLLTVAGVSGSLIVSPVLAVLAVGVGVPIMLAYVYGVVPLSLCRNGGCGGSNESTTLENFVEDEEELGNIATGLRVFDDEEQSRLLRKQLSDIEKLDRSSMATRVSTNSGFSLNAASTSAAGSSSRTYGTHGHATQADVLSSSSAKINLMVEQRKRKMSVESYATVLGDKINFENASTKAQAGSHYHFDNKSVHTVCSGGSEVQSYCCENEESSSIKPMSGSIDGKSLADSASLRFARQCRANSRPERDLSPSSINSLNDQPTAVRQRLSVAGQHPTMLSNTLINTSTSHPVDVADVTSESVGSSDNHDPFRVRSFLDNLRQILNDNEDEPVTNIKVHKKRSTIASKQNSKSALNAGGGRVAAKIQYDTHQRALSVQIPNASTSLFRNTPASAADPEPLITSLTSSGAVLGNTVDELKEDKVKRRRRRFVSFFRPFRNKDPVNK